jgi:superfamily I DNA and/or RNA helicase
MNREAELVFYIKLLEKELEVMKRHALKLSYYRFSSKPGEITFFLSIKSDHKDGLISKIRKHVEDGNDIEAEAKDYTLSVNSDRKKGERLPGFSGKPYWFNEKEGTLKLKEYYSNGRENFPESGILSEDLSQMEEEKKRQLQALRKIQKSEVVGPELCYYLFNSCDLPRPRNIVAIEQVFQKDKGGKALNYSENQLRAIQNALELCHLSLIQGPPGTGKTTVITEIVFQLLDRFPNCRILITSQTNNAVDQVLENLIKSKISVLRLAGKVTIGPEIVKAHTIDRKLEGWKKQVYLHAKKYSEKQEAEFLKNLGINYPVEKHLVKIALNTKADWKKSKVVLEQRASSIKKYEFLKSLPDNQEMAWKLFEQSSNKEVATFFTHKRLQREWQAEINTLDEKSMLNQRLVKSVRVIGATCNHIASKKYDKYRFEFDYVIMDESGKATTAEALVPITMARNLILVGDHRQLKPTLTNNEEVKHWLKDEARINDLQYESEESYIHRPSMFETIIGEINPDYKTQLTECRRSSREQVELTSKHFYEAFGDKPILAIDRPSQQEHNLPFSIQGSVFFIDTGDKGSHEKNEKTKSFSNRYNAELVVKILRQLDKYPAVKGYSIGVITAYSTQSKELDRQIRISNRHKPFINIKNMQQLTVNVVDRFQGLERDIIILDLVKAGISLPLGFLEVPNRINVALSRQKKLLLIVGDYANTLQAKPRSGGKEVALQSYLKSIRKECIIDANRINQLFK